MRRHWVWFFVLLIAGVALWASLAASANGPVSSKLTAAELQKVIKGDVVLKNVINEQTHQGYGSGFCVFHGTTDQFWSVIFDYDHYLDIYPRLKKVTLISHVGNVYTAAFVMDASLTTLHYTTINTLADDKLRMSWVTDMTQPHKYFKRNDGYWQLEEISPGVLIGEYHVEVELDLGLFTGLVTKIVRSMSKEDLPDVMTSTRKRMESGGTWKRPGR